MSKAASSDPHDVHDLFDLVDLAEGNPDDDDSLDLEAYLDLEESPEITRLMQEMRAGGVRAPAATAADARSAPPEPRPHAATRDATNGPRPGREAAPAPQAEPVGFDHARREPRRLDLAAVARALGRVSVQARQLVVACPRCDGRASIVVYADRFKCFGCSATGDERALAAHLTGWDPRRVAAWFEAAAVRPDVDDTEVRRPWRLSLFAR
ncbi:MAG TPA: hypothetical protein VIM86_13250 [Thermodesulfobacteriota bacterium]